LSEISDLIQRLDECPPGDSGWVQFEKIGTEIFCFLFVPPLTKPKIQNRSLSGTIRRDAVFPVRERSIEQNRNWQQLLRELNCRMLLVEFKNYDKTNVSKKDILQISDYMKTPMGKLSILVSNNEVSKKSHARIKRNTIYSESQKVILLLYKRHLKEMLFIKERGDDPADLIIDEVEDFYLQHE
jgi:hypothetical protein